MSGYIVATSEDPGNIDQLKLSEIVFSFEDSHEKKKKISDNVSLLFPSFLLFISLKIIFPQTT